jgi:hypothetical protein
LLKKWNYSRSGVNDSSYADFYDRDFLLEKYILSVEFEDFRIFNSYDESITVKAFSVYHSKKGQMKLNELPRELIAMIIEQGMEFQRC